MTVAVSESLLARKYSLAAFGLDESLREWWAGVGVADIRSLDRLVSLFADWGDQAIDRACRIVFDDMRRWDFDDSEIVTLWLELDCPEEREFVPRGESLIDQVMAETLVGLRAHWFMNAWDYLPELDGCPTMDDPELDWFSL